MTTAGFYAVIDEINTVEDGPMEIVFELADDVFVRGTPDAIVQVVGHEEPDAGADSGDGLDAEPSAGEDGGDEAQERKRRLRTQPRHPEDSPTTRKLPR